MDSNNGNKVLLIIDPQWDFISGTLVVPGADAAMDKLARYVREHANEYDFIFITADWHPITHCSFKPNGGQWPVHCVQYTVGSSIYQPIIDALDATKADYDVLTKGDDEDHEEYSIFNNVINGAFLKEFEKVNKIDHIDICGLAGDVCVLNTVKDALQAFPNTAFNVLVEYTPSLDGGKALQNFVDSTERVSVA